MKVEIKVPSVPAYIIVNGVPEPIGKFSTDDLKQIGDVWVANLVRKARGIKHKEHKIDYDFGLNASDV